MNEVRFTLLARQDLDEILEFLGERGAKPHKQRTKIESRCRALATMPESGRLREDLAPGLRSALVAPYLILYRPADDHIQIVRVLHGL